MAGKTRGLLAVGAAAVLAAYAALVLGYVFNPSFADHLEPHVAGASWAFAQGRAIYHAPGSPERYSVLYGPLLYILTSVLPLVLGPSLVTVKLGAALAGLAALLFFGLAARRLVGTRMALILTAWLALADASFPFASHWIRSEPWMAALSSLALLVATWTPPGKRAWPAAVACGALAGALSGLKLHGAIYALPALALLFERAGRPGLVYAALSAVAAFAAPFVLFPAQISLARMIFWIHVTSQQGVSLGYGLANLKWGLFYLLLLVPFSSPGQAFRAGCGFTWGRSS